MDVMVAGRAPDGTVLHVYTIRAGGLEVSATEFGATLMDIRCPDRDGRVESVLLGFPDLDGLVRASADPAWCYPGSTVGRFANRIRDARFTIDGTRHRLVPNEGRHQRHGGPIGFDRRCWTAEPLAEETGVRFRLVSPDGDQGFPGRLEIMVDVVVREPMTLALRYAAHTDAPTHLNPTSHGYFNLDGVERHTTIEAHRLQIDADNFLPIDADALPTGEPASVAGTPFDLRSPRLLGDALAQPHPQLTTGDGFNHCFVLGGAGGLRRAAVLGSPGTGRCMEVWTTEPGVQLYTGNALGEAAGGLFRRRQAVCLETQHFPDSPNQPGYPSTLLRPGEVFRSETELRFSIAG